MRLALSPARSKHSAIASQTATVSRRKPPRLAVVGRVRPSKGQQEAVRALAYAAAGREIFPAYGEAVDRLVEDLVVVHAVRLPLPVDPPDRIAPVDR